MRIVPFNRRSMGTTPASRSSARTLPAPTILTGLRGFIGTLGPIALY